MQIPKVLRHKSLWFYDARIKESFFAVSFNKKKGQNLRKMLPVLLAAAVLCTPVYAETQEMHLRATAWCLRLANGQVRHIFYA